MRIAVLAAVLLFSCKEPPPPPKPSAPATGPIVREVLVTAKGFEPARIEVPASREVVLRFTRKEKDTCADAVLIKGDPVKHELPLDVPVDVKLTAPASGQLAFACPMSMIHGAVVVAQ